MDRVVSNTIGLEAVDYLATAGGSFTSSFDFVSPCTELLSANKACSIADFNFVVQTTKCFAPAEFGVLI